ncbi:hypothetical protein B0H65DRAFT_54288 [Neurospora tetraspora]|uniref:Uncharacterized protein n=1 Tax=Neurospora tetraspora TaxID=94610 RepID=A0AAE0JQK0_9PEZI|nr:hypothetical protein B0H65DRAFT_54288 [Neurospora tetraspora]
MHEHPTVPTASSHARSSLVPGQHGKLTSASHRRHPISSTASFSVPSRASLPLSRCCCPEFRKRNQMAGGNFGFRRTQRTERLPFSFASITCTVLRPPSKSRRTPVHDVVKVGFDVAYMFIPARIYNSVSHLTQLTQLITTPFPVSVVYGQIQRHTGTNCFPPRLGWGSGDWLSNFSNLLEAAEQEERQSIAGIPSLGAFDQGIITLPGSPILKIFRSP